VRERTMSPVVTGPRSRKSRGVVLTTKKAFSLPCSVISTLSERPQRRDLFDFVNVEPRGSIGCLARIVGALAFGN
jgi:hypothetical protein